MAGEKVRERKRASEHDLKPSDSAPRQKCEVLLDAFGGTLCTLTSLWGQSFALVAGLD